MCSENTQGYGHSKERAPIMSADGTILEHLSRYAPSHQVSEKSQDYQTGWLMQSKNLGVTTPSQERFLLSLPRSSAFGLRLPAFLRLALSFEETRTGCDSHALKVRSRIDSEFLLRLLPRRDTASQAAACFDCARAQMVAVVPRDGTDSPWLEVLLATWASFRTSPDAWLVGSSSPCTGHVLLWFFFWLHRSVRVMQDP
ncbi:hypothetical protein ACS0TY_005761 [Phlomoides rotata]